MITYGLVKQIGPYAQPYPSTYRKRNKEISPGFSGEPKQGILEPSSFAKREVEDTAGAKNPRFPNIYEQRAALEKKSFLKKLTAEIMMNNRFGRTVAQTQTDPPTDNQNTQTGPPTSPTGSGVSTVYSDSGGSPTSITTGSGPTDSDDWREMTSSYRRFDFPYGARGATPPYSHYTTEEERSIPDIDLPDSPESLYYDAIDDFQNNLGTTEDPEKLLNEYDSKILKDYEQLGKRLQGLYNTTKPTVEQMANIATRDKETITKLYPKPPSPLSPTLLSQTLAVKKLESPVFLWGAFDKNFETMRESHRKNEEERQQKIEERQQKIQDELLENRLREVLDDSRTTQLNNLKIQASIDQGVDNLTKNPWPASPITPSPSTPSSRSSSSNRLFMEEVQEKRGAALRIATQKTRNTGRPPTGRSSSDGPYMDVDNVTYRDVDIKKKRPALRIDTQKTQNTGRPPTGRQLEGDTWIPSRISERIQKKMSRRR